MSGRLKRNAEAKPSRVSSAIADLVAARQGGAAKRAAAFEVKEEEAVYDEVDEEQYEQLASKRRIETGDFIEDDNGDYMDLGEEDDLWKDGAAAAAEAATGKEGGKKRKDAGGKGGQPNKKKAVEADKDNKAKERMQAMFAKAAARPVAAVPKATDESSDAFLQSLLDDLGPAPSTGPAAKGSTTRPAPAVTKTFVRPSARPAGASRPSAAPAAAVRAAAAPAARGAAAAAAVSASAGVRRPQGAVAGRAAVGGGAARESAGAAAVGASVRHRELPSMAHEEDEAPLCEDYAGGDDGDDFSFDDPGRYIKDDAMPSTTPFGAPAAAAAAGLADASTGHSPGPSPLSALAAAADTTPNTVPIKREGSDGQGAAAAAASMAGQADGTPQAAGGQRSRLFADTPSTPAMLQACPATGWQEVCDAALDATAAEATASPVPAMSPGVSPDVKSEAGVKTEPGVEAAAAGLPVDKDGNLPFYFLDAHESQDRPDVLYLFGKVKAQDGRYQSCCALVPNMHRSLLFVPAQSVFDDASGEIAALEQERDADPDSPEKRIAVLKLLHERSTDLKAEVRALLLKHGVKHMRMVPVQRKYAFEDPNVPHGNQWVLKVRYPSTEPQLPLGLSGTHFRAVFGAHQSLLEALLIKREVKGPSWLLLSGAVLKSTHAMVSWCKLEVELPTGFKAIKTAPETRQLPNKTMAQEEAPPLTVASLSLKLHVDPASQTNEILSASVVHLGGVPVDAPMSQAEWNSPRALRNFSIVRKLQGRPWPPGFEQLVSADNASPRGQLNGGSMVLTMANERALLTCLLVKLQALDADVLVGHNISAFDLNVLLHRLQLHKVPLWSRIGRLKRNNFPKLTGGGHMFGGGASPGVASCLAGRLLCDTYLSARELVKEVDYTLKTLASSLLGQDRHELPAAELVARFDSAQGLRSVMAHGESDAWLALGLVFHLSVLPLTKQLTNLSGSLWSRTLQGQRAARIEMLLLHEFHARHFMLPDKLSLREKGLLASQQERQGKQKKGKGGKKVKEEDEATQQPDGPPDEDEDMADDGPGADEHDAPAAKAASGSGGGRGKNKPQYAGGLVLEPKKGLYDSIVIMLDFNSLYPSIIQEYNICFTTVQRPKDGGVPPLPESLGQLAPLPTVIQKLVQKRKEVKTLMKCCGRDVVQYQQLNIRQQAIKLTANSMYGCLGFTNSRFYAKPLAELVTSQGREILQSTVDLVQAMDGTNVIYGDTDSIMIHTATHDVAAAKKLGDVIKREVNKRYRLLEIELDATYKCMLLLKKKKYAAVKLVDGPNGGEVLEAKGLDIVRRDWCPLCKDAGSYALNQILSGKPKEEVVEAVHEHLRSVSAAMDAGEVPLSQFIITKQLTKRPEDYPDARNQPHVQVALRRRAAGKRDGVAPGETVPYIICVRIDQQTQQEQQTQQTQEQQQAAGGSPTPQNGTAAGSGTPPASQPDSIAAAAATLSPSQPPEADAAAPSSNGTTTPTNTQQPTPGTSNNTTAAGASNTAAGGSSGKGKKAAAAAKGHLADRAYHPDELREDSSLAIDIEYYKGQQVHPVVSRLCAPIEGTDAAHLAECLGLEGSKFGGPQAVHTSMAADLREEALQVTGSLLDDDAHYASCEPLTLTAPNGTPFPFAGVRALLRSDAPIEYGLNPPDAIGDAEQVVSAARLANQAVLAARALVVRYYAGELVSDDDMAASSGRDVCLRQVEGGAVPAGSMPAPTGGALLTRALGEDRLYTTLCHYVRLLDVRAALDTISDKGMKEEARQRLGPVARALEGAAAAVAKLRDASGYRWVDLGALFGSLRARLG